MFTKILKPALFLVCLCSCGSSNNREMLQSLLESHTAVRGGVEAIEGIDYLAVELEITERDFQVTGKYVATRSGFVRIDIFSEGKRVFTEALSQAGGWQKFGDGMVKGLTPEGAAALGRGRVSNIYGLHELDKMGYTLNLVGSTFKNKLNYWEIEKNAPDGFSERLFMNPHTFLIDIKMETSALHPDIDSTLTRHETFFMDNSNIEGVLFASKTVKRDLDSGETLQTVVIKSRQINVPVKDDFFIKPSQHIN